MAKQKPVKAPPNLRKHHWLVAGKATFVRGDSTDAGSFEHNTVITNDRQFVPAQLIGKAQQMIQMHLFEQCPDPEMRILNVHIQGVHYLGCMTQGEFYTPPPADEETAAAPAGEPAVNPGPDPYALKGPALN